MKHRNGPFAISAPTARATTSEGPGYHWVSCELLDAYRKELARKAEGSEYAWLCEYLDLWARWHAGEFRSGLGGGGGMLPAYNENRDMPRCTAGDVNGTSFDTLMLDIESAYNKLPGLLQQPVLYYYRKDMGRDAAAKACGLSVRGFDGRLNLAYHHIARLMRAR